MLRVLLSIAVVAAVLIAGALALVALDLRGNGSTGAPVVATPQPDPVETPAPTDPGRLNGPNLTAYTSDGYVRPEVKQDIRQIAGLGSTAVALIPTWYMSSPDSSVIARDPAKTPDDAGLRQAIQWAGQQGLEVIVKPHVDVLDESFRGDIQPADRTAWFKSYGKFIDHYADLAADSAADVFVVGTELKSLSSDSEAWKTRIEAVRQRFAGLLTYAANWDEAQQIQFWDQLDMIGVDAYYPLAENGEVPTQESLAAAWKPNVDSLGALSEQWGRPVLITEIGYPTQAGAVAHPFEVKPGEPADQAAQALAYQAAFAAFAGLDWMRGIMWWSWRADAGSGESPSTGYTPEGKISEQVIAAAQG